MSGLVRNPGWAAHLSRVPGGSVRSAARGFALALLLALHPALAGGAFAQTTLVLQGDPAAGQDTHIAQASSVQNSGTAAQLLSNSQPNARSRILVRFDLAAIPPGATIQSATFELFYVSTKVTTAEPLRLHRVTRAWTELGATWRLSDGVTSWTTQGGDFDPAVVASATVDGTVNVWKSWTVTSLVQGWVSGATSNQGLLLESPDRSGNNERRFHSSEATTTALRPRLTVTYLATDLRASTKSVNVAAPVAGEVLTYTLVVTNTGNAPATGVVVSDAIDPSRLDNVTPGQGGIYSGGTITWNAATTPALASVAPAPGGNVILNFTARVLPTLSDGAVIANQAILASATQSGIPTDDPSTPTPDDPTAATVREPVATLYKRIVDRNGIPLPDDPGNPPGVSGAISATVVPGDVLTYAVFFANSGSRAASNLVARDGVPPWTDFVPDGFSPGRGIRLTLGGDSDLTNVADADAGRFDPAATGNPDDPGPAVNGLVTVDVGTLASGGSGAIRFKVRVR